MQSATGCSITGQKQSDSFTEKISGRSAICRQSFFSAPILQEQGVESILLVTSATHMPRAVYLFDGQGFEVIPAPTDFSITDADWEQLWHPDIESFLLGFFPQSSYLGSTTSALKEYIGKAVAGMRITP
jgi:uncharacterized SAM-binding protein YcdF (DUF218 family)